MTTEPGSVERAESTVTGQAIFRGLLWKEWAAHRGLLMGALSVWLTGLWFVPVLGSDAALLVFGLLYALMAGQAFGAEEAVEDSEEFAFALPPTRSQRYLVRLLMGGGSLLAFTVVGWLAVAFGLPQKVWGLVVESGFTAAPARGVSDPGVLIALTVILPFLVFAVTFLLATLARSRSGASRVWWQSLVVLVAIVAAVPLWALIAALVGWRWGPVFVAPVGGIFTLVLGHYWYTDKEVAGSFGARGRWACGCLWGVTVLIILGGLLAFTYLLPRFAVQR